MLLFAAFNGATQKKKSRKVLNTISHELTPTVAVKRNGKWIKLNSKYLVVGDLISLKRGDVLAADVKIAQGQIAVDESSITGESKEITTNVGDTASAGTTVVSGDAQAYVTATGSNSRSGKTINLINQSAAPGQIS